MGLRRAKGKERRKKAKEFLKWLRCSRHRMTYIFEIYRSIEFTASSIDYPGPVFHLPSVDDARVLGQII